MIKTICKIALGVLAFSNAKAQVFYNNGATLQINSGAIVQINGGAEYNANAISTNDGNVYITNNGLASGSLTLNGSSTSQGNGKYYIEQDFINNSTFIANNSEVIFNSSSANQNISGSTITTFHDVTLAPSSAKLTANINCNINNQLNINNRELATNTNLVTVTNTLSTSVTNTIVAGNEGFVSSIAPGYFSRYTNSTNTYLFPTGSSLNSPKYRPVEITPTGTLQTIYNARFVNHDADVDGYFRTQDDGELCASNDTFYHDIQRASGIQNANVKINYIASLDGTWQNLYNWRNANNAWFDVGAVNNGTTAAFNYVEKLNWGFNPNDEHFVLAVKKPSQPQIICPGPICDNDPKVSFSATDSTSNVTFNWTVPSGSTITSGQGTSSIDINYLSAAGNYVVVQAENSLGCKSNLSDSCQVTFKPAPTASFSQTENPNNELNFSFVDLSQPQPATAWQWSFGDGASSSVQNPSYTYGGPGDFPVTLVVTQNGCTDTITTNVFVDYHELLIIPNIFTYGNHDNINDEYYITHNGFKVFEFTVYNRWGTIVYKSSDPNFVWTGNDLSGQKVSDGTYYYILKATSLGLVDYDMKGFIQVFVH